MKTGTKGIELIKHFEGCELEAYHCAAGVPTIGYGHIKGVQMGDTITQEQAEEMLVEELNEYEGYINNMVTVELNQNQYDYVGFQQLYKLAVPFRFLVEINSYLK